MAAWKWLWFELRCRNPIFRFWPLPKEDEAPGRRGRPGYSQKSTGTAGEARRLRQARKQAACSIKTTEFGD